jgi:hypothetical protein
MRILRHILLALLASLLAGLVIGTVIRLRLERPTRYFVESSPTQPAHAGEVASACGARTPGDVGPARPPVLHPGHHEEQVG